MPFPFTSRATFKAHLPAILFLHKAIISFSLPKEIFLRNGIFQTLQEKYDMELETDFYNWNRKTARSINYLFDSFCTTNDTRAINLSKLSLGEINANHKKR